MKIPQTTKEKPYIEFTFDTNNNLTLHASSYFWDGINESFIEQRNGKEIVGNSCKPEDLKEYLIAFKKNQIKEVKEEIAILQEKLKWVKSISEDWVLEIDLTDNSNSISLS